VSAHALTCGTLACAARTEAKPKIIPNPLLSYAGVGDDDDGSDSLFGSMPILAVDRPVPAPLFVTKIASPPPMARSDSSSVTVEAPFPLLAHEDILLNIHRVVCHGGPEDTGLVGILSVTNYRTVFTSAEASWRPKSHFEIALGCVMKVPAQRKPLEVVVACKDFRHFLFRFESSALASKTCSLLQNSAFPLSSSASSSMRWIFAFENPSSWNPAERLIDPLVPLAASAAALFRETTVNADFALIPSYPLRFVVPANVTDACVREVVGFRAKGRVPALRWHDATGRGGSLWRCSQPKVGISSISMDDEALFEAIRRTTPSGMNLIIDCRPFSSAVGNRAKGMGYEDVSRYPGTTIRFESIGNIHTVRASHIALGKLLGKRYSNEEEAHENWLAQVETTQWLNHMRSILSASVKLAHTVHGSGVAAIVHCSDGWDRTAQVCALVRLLLDPATRTVAGFAQLVHSEWILFGHRFRDRMGVGSADMDDEERSPVFLQFLDCVYQLHRQFPAFFEFNAALLDTFAYHLLSCRFGEFLGNCASDFEANVGKTASLFEHVLAAPAAYANPLCSADALTRRLLPNHGVVCRRVVLWDTLVEGASVPTHPAHGWATTVASDDGGASVLARALQRIRELELGLASMPPVADATTAM